MPSDQPHGSPLDQSLKSLSPRIRSRWRHVRIATVEEVQARSETERARKPSPGAQDLAERREFLARLGDGLQESGEAGEDIYAPHLDRLDVAHAVPLELVDGMPVKGRTICTRHGITTAAGLVLVESGELLGLYGVGPTTVAQLMDIQAHLARRYSLQDVAGTARIATLANVLARLNARAQHQMVIRKQQERVARQQERVVWQQQELASLAHATAALVTSLQSELDKGRLDRRIEVDSGSLKPPIRLGQLLDLLLNHEFSSLSLACSLHERLKRLVDGLGCTTVDDEMQELLRYLTRRERTIFHRRFDPFDETTLERLGQEHGISKSRVSMVVKTAVGLLRRRLMSGHVWLLRTRSAIWIARSLADSGASLETIEDELRSRGLIVDESAFDDLLVVWRALGLEQPFPAELIAAEKARLKLSHAQRIAVQPGASGTAASPV